MEFSEDVGCVTWCSMGSLAVLIPRHTRCARQLMTGMLLAEIHDWHCGSYFVRSLCAFLGAACGVFPGALCTPQAPTCSAAPSAPGCDAHAFVSTLACPPRPSPPVRSGCLPLLTGTTIVMVARDPVRRSAIVGDLFPSPQCHPCFCLALAR